MKKEIIKGKPISGASTKETPLLEVKDLKTNFYLDEGVVRAVDGANVSINRRGVLGVVGESGCGKSVLARSIIRIVRPPGRTTEGEILYDLGSSSDDDTGPTNLLDLPIDSPQMRDIRGAEISMIFQEPMVSFSPVHSVGSQIIEGNVLGNIFSAPYQGWIIVLYLAILMNKYIILINLLNRSRHLYICLLYTSPSPRDRG